jgi:2-methylcitrate dehydratase PrpD
VTTATTRELAGFVSARDELPEPARHAGRRAVLNTLGLAVGASDQPAVARLRAVFARLGGRGRATLLGRGERMPAPWAAVVNGAAAHVEDFDDTHLATVIHPGAAVIPAALAASELTDGTDDTFLDAVCIGIEVALRSGLGLGDGHFTRGWHPTGTLGHLGAAAAACRVLGTDVETTQQALGLAGTQVGGFLAALGSMTKSLHAGRAAGNGLEAALLVDRGFTAPRSVVEGRRGIGELAGFGVDYPRVTDQLGTRWELAANTFKPYACGIVSHPVLDAARELGDRAGPNAEWRELTTTVNPVVLEVMGVERPTDGLASKFSVYHCVALGLQGYAGGPESFTDGVATDPAVTDLRARVSVRLDPDVRRDEAHLVGVTDDGTRHEVHVEHARGSLKRPLTDDDLTDKARLVAAPVLGSAGVDELVSRCWKLGDGAPVRDLVAASVPAFAFER